MSDTARESPANGGVLITEAGEFVGPSLARLAAAAGRAVILHGAAPGQVEELRAAGADAISVPDSVVPQDGPGSIWTADGWRRLVSEALDGSPQGLGCALVRPGRYAAGSFLDADERAWELVKQNMDATFHALQALIPAMCERGGGRIVVMTSAHAVRPEPGFAIYAASRAGQNALVRAVGLEHARAGVVINAVGTDFIDFPQWRDGASEAEREAVRATIPTGRFAGTDELAEFVAPLLFGTTRHLAGQFFSFSGGWSD